MRKLFGGLAVLSFLFVLGTVGGMERETIDLATGLIQCGIAFLFFVGFAYLAEVFEKR